MADGSYKVGGTGTARWSPGLLLQRSIRSRLLALIILLSLPLLIISFLQLNTYRKGLNNQEITIARMEATAASGALASWLETHESKLDAVGGPTDEDAAKLYRRLSRNTNSISQPALSVWDSTGRLIGSPVNDPIVPATMPVNDANIRIRWTDGLVRMTAVRQVEPWGWRVAVGIPLTADTAGGYSIVVLTAAWLFGVLASLVLGIWAAGRFTNPLRQLARVVAKFGEGNLSTRVPIETRDEVGDLAASFNRMASQLQNQFFAVQAQPAFNVTHELRTPLNVILGLCQLLERDPQAPLNSEQREAVVRMVRNAHALLELVNELMAFSKLEAGRAIPRIEWIDVESIVDGIANDYSTAAAAKDIRIRVDLPDEMPRLLTDECKLRQILESLVGNALKFTPAGSVWIKVEVPNENLWTIEIKDTGIGIPADALEFIFDEFRQVDERLTRPFGGSGLGLAIAKKLTELLHGTIEVSSTLGEGSSFLLTFPRSIYHKQENELLSRAPLAQSHELSGLAR